MAIATVEELHGLDVVTTDGSKLGKIDDVYLDDVTKRPDWATVKFGMLGHKKVLVPLATARREGDSVRVPFDQDTIKNAPHQDPGAHMTPTEEAEVFDHYGIPYDASALAAEMPMAPPAPNAQAPTAMSDGAMTRSEEELRVRSEPASEAHVRLHKYVESEPVETTVPVSHEEARVEREPITDANVDAAMQGPPISEAEHEVTLHEDRPVVEKEAVPKERVRLEKDTVVENVPIEAELKKERIEREGDERS